LRRDTVKNVPASVRQRLLNIARLPMAPVELRDVVRDLSAFIGPIAEALSAKDMFYGTWRPPGPWVEKK